jgi:hypothetical protein
MPNVNDKQNKDDDTDDDDDDVAVRMMTKCGR